jgi:hypothetical protein
MNLLRNLIVFVAIVISVNNFALYYAIQNKGKHARIRSIGMLVFLFSLIEIVAIGIWGYINLR